jgi:hypothetical protein
MLTAPVRTLLFLEGIRQFESRAIVSWPPSLSANPFRGFRIAKGSCWPFLLVLHRSNYIAAALLRIVPSESVIELS